MDSGSMAKRPPPVNSLQDLTIIEAFDPGVDESKYVTFYLVTDDDELFFGQTSKKKREMSLDDYASALQHVPDHEIYPEVPAGVELTVAPETLDEASAHVKRPGLNCYETMKGGDFVPRAVLEETLVMEQIAQSPHPCIVRYLGCHVRRGRITAIALERLDQTLAQFAATDAFRRLDTAGFLDALESAVGHLHSLGLAHNDINPDIMVRAGMPVLIDFGSCQPFGRPLQSLGSVGWYEEEFFTSEEKHDAFSLGRLREWLQARQ